MNYINKIAHLLINVPRTYNDSLKHMNLRFFSINIFHNHLPLWLVPVFTHERTNTCNGRVKMNVFIQVKVTGVVFKVFENLLMSHEWFPFWRKWKIRKGHHLLGKIGSEMLVKNRARKQQGKVVWQVNLLKGQLPYHMLWCK